LMKIFLGGIKMGTLITFEGIDGSGKTTQILKLVDYLTNKGYNVISTREPGGTFIGEQIRNLLLHEGNKNVSALAELFLFSAAREQLLCDVIRPSLLDGKIVLCDRFIDSTFVYQGYVHNISIDNICKIQEVLNIEDISIDLTLLLDVTPETVSYRHKTKILDQIELNNILLQNRIKEGYLKIANNDFDRVKIIDGNKSIDEVHIDICKIVDAILL